MVDIVAATKSYEAWLASQTAIVPADLTRKHKRMRESAFVFLRGTFYRWLQQWDAICHNEQNAPIVRAVGDLHLENFGTWRDTEGRLIWGVNDVDEVCDLPYTNDLVRLATSAALASRERHLSLSMREICSAVLEGYAASLKRGGRAIVLAEKRAWLRRVALSDLRDPVAFWRRMRALAPATGEAPHDALRALMPNRRVSYKVFERVAGVGSLGRRRVVALADWTGGLIAREAKALVPSAAVWAGVKTRASTTPQSVLRRAVRVRDPYWAVVGPWIVRRLAPDCSRIEVEDLPAKRDERKLLRAMGWETANIHQGSTVKTIARDLKSRGPHWLRRAAFEMTDAVVADWQRWTDA
jgi:uncharacterized protein (DUF2252 family)